MVICVKQYLVSRIIMGTGIESGNFSYFLLQRTTKPKNKVYVLEALQFTSSFAKKKPVDFDDELKIGDVRYDNMTKLTIKVQLFWRLPYEM